MLNDRLYGGYARNDPECGWVGGQCWSSTACNAIGVAWSADGATWEHAEHVVVRTGINPIVTLEKQLYCRA